MTTEEITSPDGAFAIVALEWFARNPYTIARRGDGDYRIRALDGAISRESYPTAAAAVAAAIGAGGFPEDVRP